MTNQDAFKKVIDIVLKVHPKKRSGVLKAVIIILFPPRTSRAPGKLSKRVAR